jgi:c-di-AMP phosphodiesterase-like protein
MWRSWAIGLLGIWIIIIPFLFDEGMTQVMLLVVSGALVTLLAFSKLISEQKEEIVEEIRAEIAENAEADSTL